MDGNRDATAALQPWQPPPRCAPAAWSDPRGGAGTRRPRSSSRPATRRRGANLRRYRGKHTRSRLRAQDPDRGHAYLFRRRRRVPRRGGAGRLLISNTHSDLRSVSALARGSLRALACGLTGRSRTSNPDPASRPCGAMCECRRRERGAAILTSGSWGRTRTCDMLGQPRRSACRRAQGAGDRRRERRSRARRRADASRIDR